MAAPGGFLTTLLTSAQQFFQITKLKELEFAGYYA
jgi:hypothetical protein